MTQNDGGPAFPVQDLSKWQCSGVSLRDYFAGQMLGGFTNHWDIEYIAKRAYEVADAMLKAREQ